MKEMLDAGYNELVMLQASIYHWYNEFKNGRCEELMGRRSTPWRGLNKH